MFCKLLLLALVICYVQAECGKNEVWHRCGKTCEPICADRQPPCNAVCRREGCRCKPDFFRDPNGSCVAAKKCP